MGGAVIATLEHGASGLGGALVLMAAQVIRDRFRAPKPIEESAAVISTSWTALTDNLDHEIERQAEQIETLRADNERLRLDLLRVRRYAEAVFAHIATLEAQLAGAGLVPASRPSLPTI